MALPSRRPGVRPTNARLNTVPRGSAPRRNPVSQAPGIEPVFIRIGIICVIALIGGVWGMATAKPKGDQAYWTAMVRMDRITGKSVGLTAESLKKSINDLPISGVKDPKLKEFHQLMLQMITAIESPNGDAQLEAKLKRYKQLLDELNAKYAR